MFRRAKPQFELDTDAAETPADVLHRRQATRIVYTILDQLSERDRTLLILFELERLPITQVAAVLAISDNNVSVSLHRARERFRRLLRLHFPDEARGTKP